LLLSNRSYTYLLEAHANQMTPEDAAMGARNFKRAFLLGISDKDIFPNHPDYISERVVANTKTRERTEMFCFAIATHVHLSNFTLSIDQVKTTTEKWCYILNHANEANQLDLEPWFADDEIFKRTYEELNMDDRWSKEEIRRYELEMQSKSQQDAKDEDEEDD
jgi:hypothetical protein